MPVYTSEVPGDFEYQVAIRRLIDGPFDLNDKPSLRNEVLRDLSTRYQNQQRIFRFDLLIPGAEIEADFINDTQNSLFVEIHALYEILKTVQGRLRAGNSVINSEYLRAMGGLKRLRADIKQHELIKDNPSFSNAFWIDFKFEGNAYAGSLPAEIDESFGRLRLSRQVVYDVTLPDFEYRPQVEVELVTPGTMVNMADSGPEKAIDPNPESYWGARIYTDQPVKSFDIELPRKKLPEGRLGRLETYSAAGSVVAMTLSLPKAQFINSIELKPFGKFPIKVIDISVAASDNESFRQIPAFDITEATQNRSPIVLDFEVLPAKQIKILIEQANYEYTFVELTKEALAHNQMFDAHLTDESNDLIQSYSFLDSEEIQILDDPKKRLVFMAVKELSLRLGEKAFSDTDNRTSRQLNEVYADLIKSYGVDTMKNFATATMSPGMSKIGKISYSLGLGDVRVRYNSYAPEGEWRSNKFQNAQHISRFRLVTDEEHPVLYDSDSIEYRGTAVHWDIDVGQDKKIPIVPYNYRNAEDDAYIPSEVLPFHRRNLSIKTRFPIDISKPYSIRMNGSKMRDVSIYSQNDTRVQIPSSAFNPDAVYTIGYHPLPNFGTSVFDVSAKDYLDSRPLESPEVFNQTNSDNAVVLSTYPYIEPEIINDLNNFHRPNPMDGRWLYAGKGGTVLGRLPESLDVVQVEFSVTQDPSPTHELVLIDGKPWGRDGTVDNFIYEPIKVTIDGEKAYNITNYINGRHPAMVGQAEGSRKYQYVHKGNRLIFNGPVREKEIKVEYRWLVRYTRLTARLFCGRSFSYDITPRIRSAGLLYSRRAL
jgi:hypothetical protein